MNSRIFFAWLLRISLFVMFLWLPNAANSQTQDEMNRIACAKQREIEEKLGQVYTKILGKYQADKTFIKNIKNAQQAWLAYREAHIKSLYPHENSGEYGTVYPMCRCDSLAEITGNRIKELEQWIEGIELGEVCTGSRAVKQ